MQTQTTCVADEIRKVARAARRAGKHYTGLGPESRSAILRAWATALRQADIRSEVMAANARDMAAAREAQARGELDEARVRRLALAPSKLDSLCAGLEQLADAPDLLAAPTLTRDLDEGLTLVRQPCPLGTLGIVFEARPDAVVQIAGLAFKTANGLLLKGGSEALHSNRALTAVLHRVLVSHGVETAGIALLEQREEISAMLACEDVIDLVIARGSGAFVSYIQANTKIPVMGHAEGLCHMVLHGAYEPALAAKMVVDAKCSYPAACNAVETLLWTPGAEQALAATVAALQVQGVELRGCPTTLQIHGDLKPATADDWALEYGSFVLAIRQVPDLDAALAHIEHYGSRHTEALVSEDAAAAERFLAEVDAACVFHNASTRFADGYRFGLGAEVGISTGKLHARGPVGVEGLLTYRWLMRGQGQASSDYGPGKRPFLHRER
ncbi:MAG: glutamate-5-semialdehyde dehydrogenase [Nannocystaceae bacterium]